MCFTVFLVALGMFVFNVDQDQNWFTLFLVDLGLSFSHHQHKFVSRAEKHLIYRNLSWVLTVFCKCSYQCWTWDNRSDPLSGVCWVLFKHLHLRDVFLSCFCCWNASPLLFPCFRVAAWIRPIKAWRCSWWPLANRTCRRFCLDPSPRTRKPLSFNNRHTQSSLPLWTLQKGPWLIHKL